MSWIKKAQATGDCFRVAAKWASEQWANHNRDIMVVHGRVTNMEGRSFMHAWCEEGDQVIDLTTLGADKPMDKEKWYSLTQAEPLATYTAEEAIIKSIKERHWGPWHEDSYCRNSRYT